ncbi:MAG: hypothetical protein GW859_09125 [Sphingomonadales bacterium]|nr:hypothetical protein [Sphingomonadales bacterium]
MIAPYSLTWLGETLAVTSVLMLIVLAIRRPFISAFGPRIAYFLWSIPLVRLLTPAFVGDPLAEPALAPDISAAGTAGLYYAAPGIDATAPSLFEALWGGFIYYLPQIWFMGAGCLLLAIFWSHLGFRRRILGAAMPDRWFQGCQVMRSPVAQGPLAIGLFRRLIVVPVDFEARFDQRERNYVLWHEAEHHRHGDLWANVAAAIMLSVHWFNPIAWVAWRAFRLDQEQCCDARVTARADGSERFTYALTLAKAATGSQFLGSGLVAPIIERHSVGQRLISLKQARSFSKSRLVAGVALIGMLAATSLLVTATVVPASAIAADEQAAGPEGPSVARSSSAQPFSASSPTLSFPMDTPLALPPSLALPEGVAGSNGTAPAAVAAIRPVMSSATSSIQSSSRSAEVSVRQSAAAARHAAEAVEIVAKAKRDQARIAIDSDFVVAKIPRVQVVNDNDCDADEPVRIKTIPARRGRPQTMSISICSDESMARAIEREVAEELREARADVLESLIEARSEVEEDEDIPVQAKAAILAGIAKEIAKLKSERG